MLQVLVPYPRPALEIIRMQGGYTAAEGHSNIIPANATTKITCRLVNNQEIYGKQPFQYTSGGSVGAMLSVKEVLGLHAYPRGFELSDENGMARMSFSGYQVCVKDN